MTIFDLVIRLLAAGAGVVLLYVGLCVDEDQEKALQSRIEDWRIELDDLRRSMTARHATFASTISRRANGVLGHVFRGTPVFQGLRRHGATLSIASVAFLVSNARQYATDFIDPEVVVQIGTAII